MSGPSDIVARIRAAGIVGAGGAGFPTHVKASSKAEIVLVNGAECEPLMSKDVELLRLWPESVLDGLALLMRATGADRGILALKAKHKALVEKLSPLVKARGLELKLLGDHYPAGDEFCLVYEATGRLIPPGGIPIQIGVVVQNVETLHNIARADRTPVVEKFLTVAGAVRKPLTTEVPVGIPVSRLVELAGGALPKEFLVLDGGAMMGRVLPDLSAPVTKTSGGIIVLPKDHPLIRRKSRPRSAFSRIGRSACDQCSFCTELCPRYLLGYPVQPHRAMRTLGFAKPDRKIHSEWALLCCECSLCSLYSCPEELDPKNVCVASKADLLESGTTWKDSALKALPTGKVHPMREHRLTPMKRLVRRLGLDGYESHPHFVETPADADRVVLPLKQHIGEPAAPLVRVGQRVRRGEPVAEVPEGRLGARIHASIDGVVLAVGNDIVIGANHGA